MRRLENHVTLITGASRGIGRAIAVGFAREGATVIGLSRGSQAETAAQCRAAGGRFEGIAFDAGAATRAFAGELIASLVEKHGRLDALVNNAGMIRRAPAIDYAEADWDEVIRVNLTAPFILTQALARWWITRGRQAAAESARLKIINIASLLSFQGGVLVAAYTASKHGIAGLTRALANEWAAERVNVNAIAPGYITTDNTQALRDDPDRSRAILARIPEGRWGRPEDIAGGCLFLASADADYLNGCILNIDGGWLGR